MLTKPATDYASVIKWTRSLADHWGGAPLAEDPARLDTLVAFCEFIGKDPDELLEFCFLYRRATGEKFPSKKRREEVTAKVREFVAASGLKGGEARRQSSNILSFLSHNGILI
jgi:hypothetical protein